jgi:hypothetical protein
MHYKKDFVVPRAIVPGLNTPGDLESFLFPSHYIMLLHYNIKALGSVTCQQTLSLLR